MKPAILFLLFLIAGASAYSFSAWSADGSNVAGSSMSNLQNLEASFDQVGTNRARINIQGNVTVTYGGVPGSVAYNSFNNFPDYATPKVFLENGGVQQSLGRVWGWTQYQGPIEFFIAYANGDDTVFSIQAQVGTSKATRVFVFNGTSFEYDTR